MCELLLCSVHSSSYSGGKQKSDRQIYYSVIDITDSVHNKAGHLFKTKQWQCSGEPWHFFRACLSGLGQAGVWWCWELVNVTCIGMTEALHAFKTMTTPADPGSCVIKE